MLGLNAYILLGTPSITPQTVHLYIKLGNLRAICLNRTNIEDIIYAKHLALGKKNSIAE